MKLTGLSISCHNVTELPGYILFSQTGLATRGGTHSVATIVEPCLLGALFVADLDCGLELHGSLLQSLMLRGSADATKRLPRLGPSRDGVPWESKLLKEGFYRDYLGLL